MKIPFLIVAFSLFVQGLQAQTQHLFTLTELEQLADCPDQGCFQRIVRPLGYQYLKQDSKVTDSTVFRTYFNRQMEPYRAEALVFQQRLTSGRRQVTFSTNNKAFVRQLEADIQASNYVLTGQSNPGENREYIRQAGNQSWMLRRHKPNFSRVSENFIITLYNAPAARRPAAGGVIVASNLPHLGGDWDAKYPVQNATDLLEAERKYTADYDKKQGKVGHTFSRAEKVRIQGRRTGQYRPLTDQRWDESFDPALRSSGFEVFANARKRMYQREALFDFDGERIWVPIQEVLIRSLEQESSTNTPVVLYAVLVSRHDFSGTLHISFLVNEFAAPTGSSGTTLATNSSSGNDGQLPVPVASQPVIAGGSGTTAEEFNTFIRRFSSDRTFQLARTRFPLVWKEQTNDETIVHRETTSTWRHYDVLKPTGLSVSVKAPTAQKPNEASIFVTCQLACGFADQLLFRKIAGKWYCVAREMMNG